MAKTFYWECLLNWKDRLKQGLSRSRTGVWTKAASLFSSGKLSEDEFEELEEILYGADLGLATVKELMEDVRTENKKRKLSVEEFKDFLRNFLRAQMEGVQSAFDPAIYKKGGGTKVIMVVGVNGAGKTTTIGKLASKLAGGGAKVVVGACDTFRAAAVDQLQVWCDRAEVAMVRAKEGAAPSGVGYSALQEALSVKADFCILDTAGRLHTKDNLMQELGKSKEVLKKLDSTAPHQVLLVIDAITGQNAITQAREFDNCLDISGIVLTKCDSSSKAGSAVAIVRQLQKPIIYMGVGEQVEDLNLFDLNEYLEALI